MVKEPAGIHKNSMPLKVFVFPNPFGEIKKPIRIIHAKKDKNFMVPSC
jgi:hypothetical protein